MSNNYFEDQVFDTVNFLEKGITTGTYEGCTFINCNFSTVDISGIQLVDGECRGCDWSNVQTMKTVLNNVLFKDCKMLGINFENCSEFLFLPRFENCILNFSSFYKRHLKNTQFKNCSLQEVDFTESDCNSVLFDHCDMNGARFENTILEKADLRTAFHYSIDPQLNRMKKAKFSLTGIAGLLDKYDIIIQ